MALSRSAQVAILIVAVLAAGYAGYRRGLRVRDEASPGTPTSIPAPTAFPSAKLQVAAGAQGEHLRLLWLVYEANALRSAWAMTYLPAVEKHTLYFTPVYPFRPDTGGSGQSMQAWEAALERSDDSPPDLASLDKFIQALALKDLDGFVVLDVRRAARDISRLSGEAVTDYSAPLTWEDLAAQAERIRQSCSAFMQAPSSARTPLVREITQHLFSWPRGDIAPAAPLDRLLARRDLLCAVPVVAP